VRIVTGRPEGVGAITGDSLGLAVGEGLALAVIE
jgi:hypothetical protein